MDRKEFFHDAHHLNYPSYNRYYIDLPVISQKFHENAYSIVVPEGQRIDRVPLRIDEITLTRMSAERLLCSEPNKQDPIYCREQVLIAENAIANGGKDWQKEDTLSEAKDNLSRVYSSLGIGFNPTDDEIIDLEERITKRKTELADEITVADEPDAIYAGDTRGTNNIAFLKNNLKRHLLNELVNECAPLERAKDLSQSYISNKEATIQSCLLTLESINPRNLLARILN